MGEKLTMIFSAWNGTIPIKQTEFIIIFQTETVFDFLGLSKHAGWIL